MLQDELTQCLDDLFFETQSVIRFKSPSIVELISQPLLYELRALFGEANLNRWDGSRYYFAKALKGHDGPPPNTILYRQYPGHPEGRYKIASPHYNDGIFFLSWLQRRIKRLRATATQGKSIAASVPSPTCGQQQSVSQIIINVSIE